MIIALWIWVHDLEHGWAIIMGCLVLGISMYICVYMPNIYYILYLQYRIKLRVHSFSFVYFLYPKFWQKSSRQCSHVAFFVLIWAEKIPYYFETITNHSKNECFILVSLRCSGCFLLWGLDWDLSKRQTNVLAINFHNIFTNSDDSNRRDMAHGDANTAQLIDNRSTHVCAFNRRVPERNGIRGRER